MARLVTHLQRASLLPFHLARVAGSRILPSHVMGALEDTTAVLLNHALKELGSELRVLSKDAHQKPRNGMMDLQTQAETLTEQLEEIQSRIVVARQTSVMIPNEYDVGEEYEEPDELTRVLTKWYTVPSSPHISYRMLRDFELYPQWMPWCTRSQVLDRDEHYDVKAVEVSFGIRAGLLGSVNDSVRYQVDLVPPDPEGELPYRRQAKVIATNNGCTYASKLQYQWTLTPIDSQGKLSKVELKLTFKAKYKWYLVLWDTLREKVVGDMAAAFTSRHTELQEAQAKVKFLAEGHPLEEANQFPGYSLQNVLDGPFREQTPAAVTEKDGRTIRYVNEAFTELTGYQKDEAEGQWISDLLQGEDTNVGVTRALGSSIIEKVGANGRVVNYRKDGTSFLNHLSLEPILDTESESGIIFWAVLHNIGEDRESLEVIKGPHGQRLLPSKRSRMGKAWDAFTTRSSGDRSPEEGDGSDEAINGGSAPLDGQSSSAPVEQLWWQWWR